MATIKDLLSAMISKINRAPKTVNGVEPDENGNITSSWNDLPDKPFGEEVVTKTSYDIPLPKFTSDEWEYVSFIGVAGYDVIVPFHLVEGQKYTVICNGEAFVDQVAHRNENLDADGPIAEDEIRIGTFDHIGMNIDRPGEPYIYLQSYTTPVDGGYKLRVGINTTKYWEHGDMTPNVDVSIVIDGVDIIKIKTLDSKYLPEALQIGEEQTPFISSITFEATELREYGEDGEILGIGYALDDPDGDKRYMLYTDPSKQDELIAPFTVVFDSIVYPNVAPVRVDSYVQYAGNAGLLPGDIASEDTGEPFVIFCSPYGAMIICATEGTHTVEAYHETIKTIDPKYLPSGAILFWEETDDDTYETVYRCNKSFNECYEAALNGTFDARYRSPEYTGYGVTSVQYYNVGYYAIFYAEVSGERMGIEVTFIRDLDNSETVRLNFDVSGTIIAAG